MNRVRTVLLPPALAVLFAALLCAVALLVSGDNPLTALAVMITQVGEGTTAVDIVKRRFAWHEFLDQAWFMTRVSLLPTILVAIPFGVIVSIQVGAIAEQIGAVSFTGAVNGIGVLRQGAPLVTSLLLAGAVGSAMCAQLGAQAVREEVDAMRVMGLNPVQRLVAPRLLAAVVVGMLQRAADLDRQG